LSYLGRLQARVTAVGSCLCLGIDPDPATLPRGLAAGLAGVEHYGRLVLEVAGQYAAAVKVNLAFFEAFGSAGLAALERLRRAVPDDLPFIADAKRSDIGSTSRRHAAALFDALGADAVTANPYLGRDALEPFLARSDRFTYVLCRTSNPGAGEVQNLDVGGRPLYLRVAELVAHWAGGEHNVGLVVGATAPVEMAGIRAAVPGLPFLVPGVGAQAGDIERVLADGPATAWPASRLPAGGLLVNVSRAISQVVAEWPAGPGGDDAAADALAGAAADWARRLHVRIAAG